MPSQISQLFTTDEKENQFLFLFYVLVLRIRNLFNQTMTMIPKLLIEYKLILIHIVFPISIKFI